MKLAYNIVMVQFADKASATTAVDPTVHSVKGCEAAVVDVQADKIVFTCNDGVGSGVITLDEVTKTLKASITFSKGLPYVDFPIAAGASLELSCWSPQ